MKEMIIPGFLTYNKLNQLSPTSYLYDRIGVLDDEGNIIEIKKITYIPKLINWKDLK